MYVAPSRAADMQDEGRGLFGWERSKTITVPKRDLVRAVLAVLDGQNQKRMFGGVHGPASRFVHLFAASSHSPTWLVCHPNRQRSSNLSPFYLQYNAQRLISRTPGSPPDTSKAGNSSRRVWDHT